MTLAFHVPGAADGWIRRLDSRWKIATIAILVAGVLSVSQATLGLGILVAVVVIAISGGVAPGALFRRIAPVAGMILVFFSPTLLTTPANNDVHSIFGLTVSRPAFETLTSLVIKTSATVAILATLLETTTLAELGQGLAGLGVPRIFVQLILMTERYVFVLTEEFSRLRRALRVRGFRNRMDRRSFAIIGDVTGMIFLRGHERSQRVHHAMAARGFDGVFRSLTSATTSAIDVAVLFATLIAVAAIVVIDRGWWPR